MSTDDPTTTLVIIPTYNEAENIRTAVSSVLEALPDAHVLVVDDGSPDGTGAIANALVRSDERIHVLHRAKKDGLGGAYLTGFAWALDRGYDFVGEFDADGSHPATALPAMRSELAASPDTWLAIGSRWVAGGSVVNWPKTREILSRGGNAYARIMLGLGVRDATAGFRLFRADALRRIGLDSVVSKGYCFQVDLTIRTIDAGGQIAEVPIRFQERKLGDSKMSRGIVLEAMAMVTVWGLQRRITRMGLRAVGASTRATGARATAQASTSS